MTKPALVFSLSMFDSNIVLVAVKDYKNNI